MKLKFLDLSKFDKKTKLYIGIGVGSILLLFIILISLKIIVGSRINSNIFEVRIKNAAISYYKKYPEKLPKENGGKVTITIDELVNSKQIKSMDKLLKKGLTCNGEVNVSNNNGFYLYQPNIECSDKYKTNLLYKKILEDNPLVESGNGLYKMNDFYIYRGENLNNYVQFAGYNWQILRINNDNTIKLIYADDLKSSVWDNRYNTTEKKSVGKNDFTVSRIKNTLNDYFSSYLKLSNENKALIVPKRLCIGARNPKSKDLNDNVECSKTTEQPLPIGLLLPYEYAIASLEPTCKGIYDIQCVNYNFMVNYSDTWTITANSENTYEVYYLSGIAELKTASETYEPRFVINISSDALYSKGDGSYSNPYLIN